MARLSAEKKGRRCRAAAPDADPLLLSRSARGRADHACGPARPLPDQALRPALLTARAAGGQTVGTSQALAAGQPRKRGRRRRPAGTAPQVARSTALRVQRQPPFGKGRPAPRRADGPVSPPADSTSAARRLPPVGLVQKLPIDLSPRQAKGQRDLRKTRCGPADCALIPCRAPSRPARAAWPRNGTAPSHSSPDPARATASASHSRTCSPAAPRR